MNKIFARFQTRCVRVRFFHQLKVRKAFRKKYMSSQFFSVQGRFYLIAITMTKKTDNYVYVIGLCSENERGRDRPRDWQVFKAFVQMLFRNWNGTVNLNTDLLAGRTVPYPMNSIRFYWIFCFFIFAFKVQTTSPHLKKKMIQFLLQLWMTFGVALCY